MPTKKTEPKPDEQDVKPEETPVEAAPKTDAPAVPAPIPEAHAPLTAEAKRWRKMHPEVK